MKKPNFSAHLDRLHLVFQPLTKQGETPAPEVGRPIESDMQAKDAPIAAGALMEEKAPKRGYPGICTTCWGNGVCDVGEQTDPHLPKKFVPMFCPDVKCTQAKQLLKVVKHYEQQERDGLLKLLKSEFKDDAKIKAFVARESKRYARSVG